MEDDADLFPPARPQVRHRRRRLHPGQLCGAHRQGRQCGLRSDRAPALGKPGGARRAEKEVTRDGSQDWRRRMKILGKALAGAALCVAAGISVAAAHHSTTMFDHSKTLTLKGVVIELRWTNPHVTLLVNGTVKDGDQPSEWLLEMTSPGNLTRAGGWSRSAVKPGDKVTVDFAPLRDGKKGGALKKIMLLESGKFYTADIRAQERANLEEPVSPPAK